MVVIEPSPVLVPSPILSSFPKKTIVDSLCIGRPQQVTREPFALLEMACEGSVLPEHCCSSSGMPLGSYLLV